MPQFNLCFVQVTSEEIESLLKLVAKAEKWIEEKVDAQAAKSPFEVIKHAKSYNKIQPLQFIYYCSINITCKLCVIINTFTR